MPDLRPVLYVIGCVVAGLGVSMLIPMLIELAYGRYDWRAFATSAALTIFSGGLMVLANRAGTKRLSLREAFLLTTLSWTVVAAFSALPFVFTKLEFTVTDAFFEAISGLTTTGSTIIPDLDLVPTGILIWRSFLQWIGGIGIIVTAIGLLPLLQIGGMQLLRTESSDRSHKALPSARRVALATVAIYVALTAACAIAYRVTGMPSFDAVMHAFTTLSTGGYSTFDESFGHFQALSSKWVAVVFMLAGGLPFMVVVQSVHGDPAALWRSSQVRFFLGFVSVVVVFLTIVLMAGTSRTFGDAFTEVAFNVVSVITTTGYATEDYGLWGPISIVTFLFITACGACTGSTSGGIKIMRIQIMLGLLWEQTRRLIHPHGVFQTTFEGTSVDDALETSVMAFVALWVICFVGGTIILAMLGCNPITAISGSLTALANVGPGLGPEIGPAGNFSALPDAAKWGLCLGMLLGRLELFTVLVLLTPTFWRL